jgi:hypothetical protein
MRAPVERFLGDLEGWRIRCQGLKRAIEGTC